MMKGDFHRTQEGDNFDPAANRTLDEEYECVAKTTANEEGEEEKDLDDLGPIEPLEEVAAVPDWMPSSNVEYQREVSVFHAPTERQELEEHDFGPRLKEHL